MQLHTKLTQCLVEVFGRCGRKKSGHGKPLRKTVSEWRSVRIAHPSARARGWHQNPFHAGRSVVSDCLVPASQSLERRLWLVAMGARHDELVDALEPCLAIGCPLRGGYSPKSRNVSMVCGFPVLAEPLAAFANWSLLRVSHSHSNGNGPAIMLAWTCVVPTIEIGISLTAIPRRMHRISSDLRS